MVSEKIHILVVDDDRSHRLLARTILETHFYRITECASGAEALEAVKTNNFDLVLLDIIMPGLSGIEVCREMRKVKTSTELSILFLSGKSDELSVVHGLDAGADDYISKPYIPAIFLARIHAHLRIRNATKSLLLSRERLNNLKRLEVIGRMSAGICGHFGQVLNTIISSAEEIERKEHTKADSDLGYRRILTAARRGSMLATDLDTFFRSQGKNIAEQSISAVSESASSPVSDSTGKCRCNISEMIDSILSIAPALTFERIEYLTSHAEDLPPAKISPADFSQILFELLTNSIGAIDGRGKITVVTAANPGGGSSPGLGSSTTIEETGKLVTVTVTDSGRGIPPAEASRLSPSRPMTKDSRLGLDPLMESSGIGLILASDLARQAGGKIELVESGDHGTSLRLSLPADI